MYKVQLALLLACKLIISSYEFKSKGEYYKTNWLQLDVCHKSISLGYAGAKIKLRSITIYLKVHVKLQPTIRCRLPSHTR